MTFMFGRLFTITLFSILVLYLASFASFIMPPLNAVFFIALAVGALVLTLYKFEYGLLLMLAEIFVGSKGYLFWIEIGDARISLRMALFIIVVAVWLVGQIKNRVQNVKFTGIPRCYWPLFLAIAWGVLNGWVRGNSLSNIFSDANAWAYFILVPILASVKFDEKYVSQLAQIFLGAVSAMVLKSF